MAKTRIRASQFKPKDITDAQLALDAVMPSNISSKPKEIASVNGLVTLPDETNSFVVTGTETVSKIDGIANGLVYVKWAENRSIMHTAGQLELPKNLNHNVVAGDTSVFVIRDGVVEEVFCQSDLTDQKIKTFQAIAEDGQTSFAMATTPLNKENVLLYINGMLQSNPTAFTLAGNVVTISDPLVKDDEIMIIVFESAVEKIGEGSDTIDGGTF